MAGFFATSKYTSPVIITFLSLPANEVGYVIDDATFSHTSPPSAKFSLKGLLPFGTVKVL